MKTQLDSLLTVLFDERISRFIWLRQFEVGKNSAGASRLLDRLEFLRALGIPTEILNEVSPHRIAWLRRQGKRYFADGLQDLSSDRRLAIPAVCAVEWQAAIADTVVETHDRIVGKTWRDAKRLCDTRVDDAKAAVQQTLRSFTDLGTALLAAHSDGVSLETAVSDTPGWATLEELVATSTQLTNTMAADPLAHVVQGHRRFRRYAPRMLKSLDIRAAPVAIPLLNAADSIGGKIGQVKSTDFLRKNSKWHRHLKAQSGDDHRLWEVAVLFHLRDAFRSGDIWLRHSRRYADLKQALVPITVVPAIPRLTMPLDPATWLSDRKVRITDGLNRLARAARHGAIPGGSIENGTLKIERLTTAVPDEAEKLVLDLYRQLPDIRVTDLLLEVDEATGFTDAFTHLRTGAPCKDRIGLLNVMLAKGLNLGLSKMAEARNTHDYLQLSRLSRLHIESEAINRELARVIDAGSTLPMAKFWGTGVTASSDGQSFRAARQGEAMNLINAKYGSEPGVKA